MDTKRILFIDDEPANVQKPIEWLEGAGYITHHVVDGLRAWNLLKEKPEDYKSIIIKRILPELDGISLLTKIKRSDQLKNIPVIVATVDEDQNGYFAALEAGAYDFVYYSSDEKFWLYLINNAVNNQN